MRAESVTIMTSDTMHDVTGSIRQYVLDTALQGEPPEHLLDDTPLQTSGILDSLATLGLVAFVEERFGVELDVYDTSVDRFDTIASIASTVARKRAAQPST
jgi:acyl carrier protein